MKKDDVMAEENETDFMAKDGMKKTTGRRRPAPSPAQARLSRGWAVLHGRHGPCMVGAIAILFFRPCLAGGIPRVARGLAPASSAVSPR